VYVLDDYQGDFSLVCATQCGVRGRGVMKVLALKPVIVNYHEAEVYPYDLPDWE
jgi:hypothetical protein